MVQVRRLGCVMLGVADLAEQIAYYRDVIGLSLTFNGDGKAVLSTSAGVEAVVLLASPEPGIVGLSFQVSPRENLDRIVADLRESGIDAQKVRNDTPGVAEAVVLHDPLGHRIVLFNQIGFAADVSPGRGVDPIKLGHVARFVTDVPMMRGFYEKHFGFRVSDWREDQAVFLRCGPDHHTINFIRKDAVALGHVAFEVRNWSELGRASDHLAQNGYPLDWGPGRHRMGHNMASYHSNRAGTRIELYTEMDQMRDEELGFFEPRPWHEDRPQVPKNWGLVVSRNAWIPDAP